MTSLSFLGECQHLFYFCRHELCFFVGRINDIVVISKVNAG